MFKFTKSQMTEMAQFVSELVRQGLVYTVSSDDEGWEIELTGGF